MPVTWYPRNFTNPDLNYLDQYVRISDDALYAVQLGFSFDIMQLNAVWVFFMAGLYVIGYKEFKDDQVIFSHVV